MKPLTYAAGVLIAFVCFGSHLADSYSEPPSSAASGPAGGQQTPFSDFRSERPGVVHHITVADLPAPFATSSSSNSPSTVPRPADAKPQTLRGYSVALYADGLENPRLMRTAPNGDIFVAESRPGRVKVVRRRLKSSQRGSRGPSGSRSIRRARTRRTSTSATRTRSSASRTKWVI